MAEDRLAMSLDDVIKANAKAVKAGGGSKAPRKGKGPANSQQSQPQPKLGPKGGVSKQRQPAQNGKAGGKAGARQQQQPRGRGAPRQSAAVVATRRQQAGSRPIGRAESTLRVVISNPQAAVRVPMPVGFTNAAQPQQRRAAQPIQQPVQQAYAMQAAPQMQQVQQVQQQAVKAAAAYQQQAFLRDDAERGDTLMADETTGTGGLRSNQAQYVYAGTRPRQRYVNA